MYVYVYFYLHYVHSQREKDRWTDRHILSSDSPPAIASAGLVKPGARSSIRVSYMVSQDLGT